MTPTCTIAERPISDLTHYTDIRQALFSSDIPFTLTLGWGAAADKSYVDVATVSVRAPEWTVFIGGLLGAGILGLFFFSQRMLGPGAAGSSAAPGGAAPNQTLHLGWLTFQGGLVAVMSLLLSQTNSNPTASFQIAVTDFSGRVIVGLFSLPIAKAIAERLRSR